ncbi:MAG: DUF6607 family protein [Pseudomonadota bacterium]
MIRILLGFVMVVGLAGCTITVELEDGLMTSAAQLPVVAELSADARYEADRQAILGMAGNYKVTFDFTETVPFVAGYEVKEPKLSGAHEVVRVIEDRGDFISLQHILVVGAGDHLHPIKHWRQDWTFEPSRVLTFVGGNAWVVDPVSKGVARGAWSQVVYQVDDSPRYGAVGKWSHQNGVSEWAAPPAMRPLPRRDMTTRDDYDAVLAVNRHALTPKGWVHEQDNSKVILRHHKSQVLVREVGLNTYLKTSDFSTDIADEYWAATKGYWAQVRDIWAGYETEHNAFGLTMQGEPTALYMPLLTLASDVQSGDRPLGEAVLEAKKIIEEHVTIDIGTLSQRISPETSAARR